MSSKKDIQHVLGLMKLISQGEEDIRKGKTRPQADVFSRIGKAVGKK